MNFSYARLTKGALIPCFILALAQTACEPPGQRLFNKNAGKPPVWHTVVIKDHKAPVPPFLTVTLGTPYKDYQPVVAKGARIAMGRKENVLFTLQGLVPATDPVEKKQQEIDDLENKLMTSMANIIVKEGATPIQIDLTLSEDTKVDVPKVVVTLH